jgi:hypothetical protein
VIFLHYFFMFLNKQVQKFILILGGFELFLINPEIIIIPLPGLSRLLLSL